MYKVGAGVVNLLGALEQTTTLVTSGKETEMHHNCLKKPHALLKTTKKCSTRNINVEVVESVEDQQVDIVVIPHLVKSD